MIHSTDFICIENLTRVYTSGDSEFAALSDVSLCLQQGRFLGITGASGSGKSTLMNLLGGLDTSTSGRIYMAGKDLTGLDNAALSLYRRQITGMIFQSFNLVSSYTALENVILPMIFTGMSPSLRQERASDLLDRLGLSDRASHRPAELSGGQQQRVAIARALANDPQILLADEPTGNLDSHTSEQIMDVLMQLNGELGTTLIMISHEQDLLRNHAHEIVVLEDGRITDHERIKGEA